MSVSKYKPHVWVIPEDEANRKLVIGFTLHDAVNITNLGIATPAGGWSKVLHRFESEYVPYLQNYEQSHVVMLIDFDGVDDRREQFQNAIPEGLKHRVFVVGSKKEPEDLKQALRMKLEEIGTALGQECFDGKTELWNHELLNHNRAELTRMIDKIKPFLLGTFSS